MENECLICNIDIHLVGYNARLCASSLLKHLGLLIKIFLANHKHVCIFCFSILFLIPFKRFRALDGMESFHSPKSFSLTKC